jgi:hypothetical protein
MCACLRDDMASCFCDAGLLAFDGVHCGRVWDLLGICNGWSHIIEMLSRGVLAAFSVAFD